MKYYIEYEDNTPVGYIISPVIIEDMIEVSILDYYRTRYANGIDDTVTFEDMQNIRMIELIREKYSVNDEFKIMREHQCGAPGALFEEYNNYILECKERSVSHITEFITAVRQEV